MKIGIFVGSFNPIHVGHIHLVNELIDKKYLDKVFIIPTMPYWSKLKFVDLKHRINMIKFFQNSKIIVDDKNNHLSYTYEIMDLYKKKYPNDEIKLIIGADNLENLYKWKNVSRILEYGVIVVGRDNIDINKYDYKNIEFAKDIKPCNVSSTEIRNGKKLREKYLDSRVLKYIKDNNLYV